jgi:glycine/D-amino acid oxidase-like deaminating enzyme/nitrite reductase/ring-hydroxylating ferredoxin subunit
MKHSGNTESVWMATASRPEFAPLTQDTRADVVVVGAGIAGLTTAYLLGREGKSVIVLDSGPIISGETERTTAHLASAMDDRFLELERLHGIEGARLAAQSHAAAIDLIELIVRDENIDCGFRRLDGYLFAADDESLEMLEDELAAARRAGLTETRPVQRAPLPLVDTGPALLFPNQGQFHPLRYLAALASVITRGGHRICPETRVTEIAGGDHAHVRTAAGHVVQAGAIVIATNSPINDRVVIHTKQSAYRTYVIGAPVPRDAVPTALYWDTADPYHYVRLTAGEGDNDLLIVGGEDHRTGQADDAENRYASLEKWTRQRFPIGDITYRWSGQVLEPVDCLGFIGRNPMDEPNVFVATGDSGQGMTHGTIAGMIITDLIIGRRNPWTQLYDPSRQSGSRDLGEFVKDGANIALQYVKWLTPGESSEEETLQAGCGRVIRRGATKVAIYRDEAGEIHECSAVCPHLGGIVSWNSEEKSWDCPVHGSRFDRFGAVINGPAKSNLEPTRTPSNDA